MRIETTTVARTGSPAAPPVTEHVPASVAEPRLAPITTAVAPLERTPQVSELDALKDELRTALRAAGAELPELVVGPVYGMTSDGFMVPLGEAAQRASDFGHKNARDFVLGEIAVQLGRSRLGYDRTDVRIRDNTPLRLVVELVETASAARAMSERWPGLTDAINVHVTTIWSNIADRAKQTGAPESIRAFLLCCLSRALRKERPNVALADEKLTKVVETAAALFAELTAPPSAEEHDELLKNRGEADKVAATRVDLARTELFPHFRKLLMAAMPETAAPKSEQPRALISAEEAIARNEQRIKQRQSSAIDGEAIEKIAGGDAERLLLAIKQHDLAARWNLLDRPTPSEIEKAIDALVARGTMNAPKYRDRTIELTLRALGNASRVAVQPFATDRERGSDVPPWSLAYLRNLAGPDFGAMLSEKVQRRPARMLEEPRSQRGGLGRLFEDNARTNEAREWVEANQGKVETLRAADKLAAGLAKYAGVTAELARQLQALHRDSQAALDACRSCADRLEKSYEYKVASTFADKRAEFEALFDKVEATLELLRGSLGESGGVKGFVRSLISSQSTIDVQSVTSGAAKLMQSQTAARQYVTGVLADFPEETTALAKLLAPRLEWFRNAVLDAKREADPLLPFFDRGWLGVVAAELRRAELNASRIARCVDRLPPNLQARAAIEMSSPESLKRAFLADASDRLATRLGGQAKHRSAVGFDVAAVQSYDLPALAARPRLHSLAVEGDLLQAPLNERLEVERLGELSFRGPNKQSYSSAAEETSEAERNHAALGAYNFWCRTFDLAAPAGSFLSELLGWRAYYAPALQDVLGSMSADMTTSDVGRIVGDALERATGVHAIADVTGSDLQNRYRTIDTLAKRLATSERALKELATFLDHEQQPVNVLVHAASGLPQARDPKAAAALITPWLKLTDGRLREAARKTLARLLGVSEAEVLREHIATSESSGARMLAMHDMIALIDDAAAVETLLEATSDADPAGSAFAIFCLSEAAGKATTHTTAIADYMIRRLGDKDPYVVHFACAGFRAMAAAGSSYACEKVVTWATEKVVEDPRVAELLHAIGGSPVDKSVAVAARSAAALVDANAKKSGAKPPRPVTLTKAGRAKGDARKPRDLADCILSAARAIGDARSIDAVSDRMKVGVRLRTEFEKWSLKLPPELGPALARLDLPDAITDDAVTELSGGEPRGYLANSPELVSAMFSSAGFSAAETTILERGRIPEQLVALASHPMALDGSWRETEIASTFGDPERCKALVQLKLMLSRDLPALVGEVIASILSERTPRAIAQITYDAVTDVLGIDIPLLDPKLDAEQRQKALENAGPLDPAIDALVERAVVDRLAVVDPNSAEAKALVQYLASGEQEVAQRRLSDAIDRATSEPQARLILEPARALARRRPTNTTAKAPWLISVLRASRSATIDQIVTVRKARRDAIAASDPASLALAGDRVEALAAAVMDKREDIAPELLAPLLATLADSEDDASRQAKFAGLREVMANKDIPWTPERMAALRKGLLVIQANHHHGALERSLEQAIRFAGRLLDSARELSDADLAKHFEILARCGDMEGKVQYADNMVNMYRGLAASGGTLSPVFIEQVGLWIAAAEAGAGTSSENDRKRNVILSSLARLLPIEDATITQLVQSCAAMSLQRTAEVFSACEKHLMASPVLTAEDVKRIASSDSSNDEAASIFDKMFGSRVSLTRWQPSAMSSFNDPLKDAWDDSDEVKDAKRTMRRSLGNFFDTLAAPRGQTAEVEQVVISNHVGSFAFGAWSRSDNAARDGDRSRASQEADKGTVLSSADYAAHKANSDRIEAAARARILDGKHPVEQISMLMMPNTTAIARAFDGFFRKTIDTEWEPAPTGPRLNINKLILSEVHRIAAIKAADEAEARGESVNLIVPNVDVCEAPHEIESETKNVRLLVNLVIDTSGSTKNEHEDRLAYFKQLAVMLLNAFGAVENIELSSALISFADFGHQLMAPSRKHDMRTMCQAIGPLEAKGGTNMADGLDKSRIAAASGTYDKVIHVVITDGQPNRLGDTQAAVASLRAMGHVVVGFGVGPDALHLGNVFGDEHAISESNPDLIAGRVYNYLKEVVARVAS